VTATPKGCVPTGTVAMTVLVAVSITDTVPAPKSVTYARVPPGLTATREGWLSTGMVAMTVLVAVSITETVAEPRFAT